MPLSSFLTIKEGAAAERALSKEQCMERGISEGDRVSSPPAGDVFGARLMARCASTGSNNELSYVIKPRTRLHYDICVERNMPEARERTVISPGPAQFDGPCAGVKTKSL